MLYRKFGVLFAIGLAVLLAACSAAAGSQEEEEPQPTEAPTSEVTQQPTDEATDEQPNGGAEGGLNINGSQAAIEALAEKLGVSVEEITLVSVEHVEWSDSCLGLGGPDEMCAQAITPGWNVLLEVNGDQYEVHTDETGASVRIAENIEE